jgi:hypothetical protein
MRRYAEAVIRFRMHVIAVTLAVTTLLGAQVRHLRVVINPDALLPQGHPYLGLEGRSRYGALCQIDALCGLSAQSGGAR